MTAIYLWLNAALYLLFAAWCTLSWQGTSRKLGYLSLSRSGQSEYLVIYGGLQLGLALFFAWTAWRPAMREAGLAFALFLYGGIVLYRVITVAMWWPVSGLTRVVAGLEIALLVGAILLAMQRR